jgi:type II secretory pathway pseudopilin PulG
LIEVIVAMMVFATIATALGYTAMGALRASNISRAEQQAIDFATQKLEDLRAIDYASLGHDLAVDTAADPRIKGCSAPKDTQRKCASWTDPTSGSILEEYLVDGALASHSEVADTTLSNSSTYTISYYVTQPAEASVNYIGAGLDFKRVTVVSTWTNGSQQRQRTTSSLVTLTTRGLPVPTFKLIPQNDNCTVTLGASCVYEIELTNQGAPDSFDLSISDTARTWSYYRDAPDGGNPANGVFGPEDVLLPSGRTPALGPTQSLTIFAEVTFGATGSYGPFVLSARSVLQPNSTSATERIPNITATVNENSTQALPGQPGTPVITAQSGSLGISWAAPSFIGTPSLDYYQVEIKRADQPQWSSATVVTVAYPSTSHTFTGLTNGIVYNVRVVAHNSLGDGSYSATASAAPVVPTDNRVPGAPGTPTAAPAPDGPGSYQLAVSWAAPADLGLPLATEYRLEYKLQAASWPTTTTVSRTLPSSTAIIPGLPASTSYELRVFAVNSQGDSPPSLSTFVTTPPPGIVETRCTTEYTSASPFPGFSLANGYSKKDYSLTNKGSQWPAASSTTLDTSTSLQQGLTMSEANPGSLHLSGTELPKYSTDLSTVLPGRVISHSSLSQSTVVSSAEYSKFVDWATDVKETYYAGSGILSLWIARTDSERTEPLKLEATLYAYRKSGNVYTRTALGSPATVTIPAGETPCAGTDTWARVRLALPLASVVHLNNSGEYLGVRVWNSGPKDLRVAYGVVGDYPAGLEISGKK